MSERKPAAPKVAAAEAANMAANTVPRKLASPMPFYGVVAFMAIAATLYVQLTLSSMYEGEKNWSVAPKGLQKNQVMILYCSGCSYEGTFRQVRSLLNSRAQPELEVDGEHYPVQPSKQFIASMLGYTQFVLFLFIFVAEHLFTALNMQMPYLVEVIKDNKIVTFMLIWLTGNIIQNAFLQSGAFEVYQGNQLVWSSVKTHRLPSFGDIVRAFKKTGVKISG